MSESKRRPDYLKLVPPSQEADPIGPQPNFELDDIFGMDSDAVNDAYKVYSVEKGAEILLPALSRWESEGRISKEDKGVFFVVAMTAKASSDGVLFEAMVDLVARDKPVSESILVGLAEKTKDFLDRISWKDKTVERDTNSPKPKE